MLTETNYKVVENLTRRAKKKNKDILDLAFAWLLSKKSVSSVIAGASSIAQLKANSSTFKWKMSENEIEEVNQILPLSNRRSVGNLTGRRNSIEIN